MGSARYSVYKNIKDRMDGSRDPASSKIMQEKFPNYYKKFGMDPSALTPGEYYKGNLNNHGEKNKAPPHNFNWELAKDLYHDQSLDPSNIEPLIRERAGFKPDEVKVLEHPSNENAEAYYDPVDSNIHINSNYPKMDNESRAATVMHEFEHAKDFKDGIFNFKQSRTKNDLREDEQDSYYKDIVQNPEDVLKRMNGGHHKNFNFYEYDNPQYEITKEHINQNSPVNPAILDKFPDLKELQDSQNNFNNNIKQPYIDNNSTSNVLSGDYNMNNRSPQGYSLPDNEEDIENDKTPYDSISARAPISDPRGRNPAMEDDQGNKVDSFHVPMPYDYSRRTSIGTGKSGAPQVNFHDPLNFGANITRSDKVKSAIQSRMNPENQMVVDRIKNEDSVDRLQAQPDEPGTKFQEEKVWPKTSGTPLDLSEFFPPEQPENIDQMGGTMAPPSPPAPPMPAAPQGLQEAPQPPLDYGAMNGGNQFGNYYLAGVQGAQGGMKPQNQNTLGLELNKQNSDITKIRGKVAAAIAANSGSNTRFQQGMDFKNKKFNQGRFDSLNKDLTEEIAAGNTPFAIAAKNKQSIDNVRALISGKKDPNDLNPQEVFEVAKSLDRVLSQGQPTAASTGHLVPSNAGTWIAEALQHMSNTVQGARAGEYIKNISKTLDREYKQADSTLASTKNKRLSTVQDLRQSDPQQWNAMMTRHGIDDNGRYQQPEIRVLRNGKKVVRAPDGMWDEVQ